MDSEQKLLEQMGLEVQTVSGGCCGLAGSWGFESGHHDISLQAGEQALLPAVRDAEPSTIVVADGFSCKTQIEQGDTGRRALHVAQVMKMAREHGSGGYVGALPEEPYYEARPSPPTGRRRRRVALTALGGAAAVAAGGALVGTAARRGA
jgi:hypothetical protein